MYQMQKVSCEGAVLGLEEARLAVRLYGEYVDMGVIVPEEFPDLAKQAWARAVVLAQLDDSEEAADRAGDVVLEFQQYDAGVYALVGLMGLPFVDFREEINKALPIVDGVQEVDTGNETVGSLLSKVGSFDLSSHLSMGPGWVVHSVAEISPSSAVFEDMRLSHHPVYPIEFVVAAKSEAVQPEMIYLAMDDVSGGYVLDATGVGYLKEDLPSGKYALRRGALTTLERGKFLDLVFSIADVPTLMKKSGYCYLLAVPASMRASVSRCVGPYPEIDELRRILPNGGRWAKVEATYDRRSAGFHLLTSGSLPMGIPMGAVLGADPVAAQVDREFLDVIHRLDNRRRARDALVGVAEQRTSVIPHKLTGGKGLSLAVGPKEWGRSSADTVGGKAIGRVGFSRVDSVVHLPNPSDLFKDDPKHVKRDSDLVQRLDSGGPVSDSYFRKADNRYSIGKYMPSVRTVQGRSVLLPEGDASPSSSQGDWKNMDFAIGWRTMRLSLRKQKGTAQYHMVIGQGAVGRLDCSAVGSVAVGSGVCVPGAATVVWFLSAVSFIVREPGGSVAVSVPVSGSATGPGWLACTAVALYGCPYVDAHVVSNLDNAELVVMKDEMTSAKGLVRTKGAVNVRRVGNVDLRISTENGRDGLGVFTIAGIGLRSIVVAGIVIQANSKCEARVAVKGWETCMSVNISAPGKLKLTADFVADAAVFEDALRPSPSTPLGADFGF